MLHQPSTTSTSQVKPASVRRLSRRRALKLLALPLLLSACGQAGSPAGENENNIEMTVPSDQIEALKPALEQFNTNRTALKLVATNFNQIFQSQTTYLSTQLSRHLTKPGVMLLPPVALRVFAEREWIEPLDSYVSAAQRAELYPSALQDGEVAIKKEKKLYGLPLSTNSGVLFYRKDLLMAAGIKPPETFEELSIAAAKLQKPEQDLWGLVYTGFENEYLANSWLEVLWGYGGDLIDEEKVQSRFKAETGLQAIKWWYDNIHERKISPPFTPILRATDARQMFVEGNAVFVREWLSFYPETQAANSKLIDKVGFVGLPKLAGVANPALQSSYYLALSPYSTYKPAAVEAMRYLVFGEGAKTIANINGTPPPVKSMLASPELVVKHPTFANLSGILSTSRAQPKYYANLSVSVQNILYNCLTRKITPETALKLITEQVNTAVGV